MALAITAARQSQEPLRCGVVIAHNNQVVAQTYNQQRAQHDATAHAEILAIREAGKKLGRKNLTDCTVYCTCEPCTMCLAALLLAKVPKLFFGTPLASATTHLPLTLTSEELLQRATHPLHMTGDLLRSECEKLLL